MPNTKSAIKCVKTDLEKKMRNKVRKSAVRTLEKKFLIKISEKDSDSAKSMLGKTIALYDKAAKVGTLHKNCANRKKSRLTAKYNQLILNA